MLKDSITILAMRVAGTILWLAYTVILARTLDKESFSVAMYAVNFMLTAMIVITMGQDVTLIKYASRWWLSGRRIAIGRSLSNSRLVVIYCGSALTLALIVAVYFEIQSPITKSITTALLTAAITIASAEMALNRDTMRAIGQLWQSQLGFNITRCVVPIIGSVCVLFFGELTADIALAMFLASLLLSLVIEEWILNRVDWTIGSDDIQTRAIDVRRSALSIWPGDIAYAIFMRAPGLIAGVMLPPAQLALLLAAERIANLAQFTITAVAQAAGPQVSHSYENGREALQGALNRAGLLMLGGGLLGVLGVVIVGYPALIALGPGYTEAWPILLYLAAGHLSWVFFGMGASTMTLTDMSIERSVITIVWTALSAGLIVLGTHAYGGEGAAVGFLVGAWGSNIHYVLSLRYKRGLDAGIFAALRSRL